MKRLIAISLYAAFASLSLFAEHGNQSAEPGRHTADETPKPVMEIPYLEDLPEAACSANGRYLVHSTADGRTVVADLLTKKTRKVTSQAKSPMTAISDDGEFAIDRADQVIDLHGGKIVPLPAFRASSEGRVKLLSGKNEIVTIEHERGRQGSPSTLTVIDLLTKRTKRRIEIPGELGAISEDGKYAFYHDRDRNIFLRDLETKKEHPLGKLTPELRIAITFAGGEAFVVRSKAAGNENYNQEMEIVDLRTMPHSARPKLSMQKRWMVLAGYRPFAGGAFARWGKHGGVFFDPATRASFALPNARLEHVDGFDCGPFRVHTDATHHKYVVYPQLALLADPEKISELTSFEKIRTAIASSDPADIFAAAEALRTRPDAKVFLQNEARRLAKLRKEEMPATNTPIGAVFAGLGSEFFAARERAQAEIRVRWNHGTAAERETINQEILAASKSTDLEVKKRAARLTRLLAGVGTGTVLAEARVRQIEKLLAGLTR